MYGYTDSSEVGPGKQGGKFGLNTGFVTKFEYNPNGGKSGAQQDAIDFTVQIGEKEFMTRFFPVTKVYAPKGGGELTDTNSEDYKKQKAADVALLNATLSDIVKAFVPEETLKAALQTPMSSFADYAQVLQRLVQGVPNWQKKPVDVFLEYQFTPSGDNKRTFLTLPKNVKHGKFIAAHAGTDWKEEKTPSHLRYVREDGTVHPLSRGEWFLGSAFANQINLEGPTASAGNAGMTAGDTEGTW